MKTTTDSAWSEVRSLGLKLCSLTSEGEQHRQEAVRVRRQQHRVIDSAIAKCPDDRAFWLRIKAFSCSRRSQCFSLLIRSFELAKRNGDVAELFNAAATLAREYSEMQNRRRQALRWLREAEEQAKLQPNRAVKRTLVGLRRMLSENQRQNVKVSLKSNQQRPIFPPLSATPAVLRKLDGNCGLLTAWIVIRHFRLRTSAARLIRSCGYSRKNGVFAIGLAIALREHGLEVAFQSDPNDSPSPLEASLIAKARKLKIPTRSAISLDGLLRYAVGGHVPIVIYDTPEGDAHFSPLLGVAGEDLLLPHARGGLISRRAFLKRWGAPGVLRQSIIVITKPNRGQPLGP